MTNNHCPICGARLPLESIRIKDGTADCPSCGQVSRLSEVVSMRRSHSEVLKRLPKGCSVQDLGDRIAIVVSLQSLRNTLASIGIALFWNGIVSVFLLSEVGSLYQHFIGPLPAWFPSIAKGEKMHLGMTLGILLFLLPFIAIGIFLLGGILMSIGGKIQIEIAQTMANIRIGLGPFQWKDAFDPSQVKDVRLEESAPDSDESYTKRIAIDADKVIRFGSQLEDDRSEWLFAVLHTYLIGSQQQKSEALSDG